MINLATVIFLLFVTSHCWAVDYEQHLSAGDTSVDNKMSSAYSMHSANMISAKLILAFHGGNKFS